MKIDNIRDKNGVEVARRIVGKRTHFGVPFHGIFDTNEVLLIDSESSTGNIGYPSSFNDRTHVTKMLRETRRNISDADIESTVATLGGSR